MEIQQGKTCNIGKEEGTVASSRRGDTVDSACLFEDSNASNVRFYSYDQEAPLNVYHNAVFLIKDEYIKNGKINDSDWARLVDAPVLDSVVKFSETRLENGDKLYNFFDDNGAIVDSKFLKMLDKQEDENTYTDKVAVYDISDGKKTYRQDGWVYDGSGG